MDSTSPFAATRELSESLDLAASLREQASQGAATIHADYRANAESAGPSTNCVNRYLREHPPLGEDSASGLVRHNDSKSGRKKRRSIRKKEDPLSATSTQADNKSKQLEIEGRVMMVCNMPCRVTHDELVDAIDSYGFTGKFQVTYLPRWFGSVSNLGYGFVHFPSCADAERFALAFEGHHFGQKSSHKKCTIKIAHQQGGNNKHKRTACKVAQRSSR
jgi:hypothetical protein